MSTYVNVPSGGGLDLSKLSSGEKFLVGCMLAATPTTSYFLELTRNGSDGSPNGLYMPGYYGIDWTTIQSISIEYNYSVFTGCYPFSLTIQGSGTSIQYASGYTPSSGFGSGSATLQNVYSVGSNGAIHIAPNVRTGQLYLGITSFTTTDGKVHTAANLNY